MSAAGVLIGVRPLDSLLLWRRADAGEPIVNDPRADLDRPLSAHGMDQAARMACWLADRVPQAVSVLVSPARRTRQTAGAFGRVSSIEEALLPDRGDVSVETLVLTDAPGGMRILVGHQPMLGRLASRLLSGGSSDLTIAKGALWWLHRGAGTSGRQWHLRAVVDPDLLSVRPAARSQSPAMS